MTNGLQFQVLTHPTLISSSDLKLLCSFLALWMATPRFNLARAANIPSLNFWAPPGNSAGPLDVFDSKARFSNSMTWPLIGSTLRAYTIDQYRWERTPMYEEALTS